MATKKKRSTGNPLLRQARLQAALRYDPEREALFQLLVAAQRKRSTAEGNAMGRTRAVNALINTTAPRVAEGYRSAGLGADSQMAALGPDLMKLGPAADPFKGAIALERQGTIDALARRAAETSTDFELQRSGALQNEGFARSNAASEYGEAEGDVLRRLESLSREQGAFTAATLGTLSADEEDREIRRESDRLSHLDRIRGQDISLRGQDLSHADRVASLNERHDSRTNGATRKALTATERDKRANRITATEQNATTYRDMVKGDRGRGRIITKEEVADYAEAGVALRAGSRWSPKTAAQAMRADGISGVALVAAADLANFNHILPHHAGHVRNYLLGRQLPRHWRRRPRSSYGRG